MVSTVRTLNLFNNFKDKGSKGLMLIHSSILLNNNIEEWMKLMDDLKLSKIRVIPFPVWLISSSSIKDSLSPPFDEFQLLEALDPSMELFGCAFRAVNIDRLEFVLDNGIDVEPTNSVIFADHFEKAWEYGGVPKIILAIDYQKIKKTYLEIDADTHQKEIESLNLTYPTTIRSDDNSKLWLSKLKEDDPKVASAYERDYAYWIPGDSTEAVKAVFIFDNGSLNI